MSVYKYKCPDCNTEFSKTILKEDPNYNYDAMPCDCGSFGYRVRRNEGGESRSVFILRGGISEEIELDS